MADPGTTSATLGRHCPGRCAECHAPQVNTLTITCDFTLVRVRIPRPRKMLFKAKGNAPANPMTAACSALPPLRCRYAGDAAETHGYGQMCLRLDSWLRQPPARRIAIRAYIRRTFAVPGSGFEAAMATIERRAVDAFIKKPDAHFAVILVYGPDTGLVSERVRALVAASIDDAEDPFQLVRLDGDEVSGDPARLADEVFTIPLFGGRRAVRLRAGGRNIVPAVEPVLANPPSRLPRGDRGWRPQEESCACVAGREIARRGRDRLLQRREQQYRPDHCGGSCQRRADHCTRRSARCWRAFSEAIGLPRAANSRSSPSTPTVRDASERRATSRLWLVMPARSQRTKSSTPPFPARPGRPGHHPRQGLERGRQHLLARRRGSATRPAAASAARRSRKGTPGRQRGQIRWGYARSISAARPVISALEVAMR